MMEKNAVVGAGRSVNEKVASRGCPMCGRPVELSGSLPRCPIHGTAPFEAGSTMSKESSYRWRKRY